MPPGGGRSMALRVVALDTVVLSGAQLLNRAKGLLLIPLVVGGVGLDGYGAFVQILALVQVLTSVASLELGMGLERFASVIDDEDRQERARHLWTALLATLGLSSAGAAAFWLAAPTVSRWLLAGQHEDALAMGATVLVSNSVFSVARHAVRASRRFRLESALNLLFELGPYVALALVVVVGRGTLAQGMLAYAVANALAAGVALLAAARGLPLQRPSRALLRQYLPYSAPLALSLVEGNLLARIDFFFLGSMLGLEAVAAYNVAYRLCEALQLVTGPIRVQLMAYLARIWDVGQRERVRRILRHALLMLMLAGAGLIAGLQAYLDPLLDLLLRSDRPAGSLHSVVLIVGLGMVADAVRRMLYVVIRLEQQTGRELLYQGIGLATNIVANIVLIPRFGLNGAAIATLVSYAIMLPFISSRFTIGIDAAFIARTAWFATLAAATAAAATALVSPDGLLSTAASGSIMVASYLALALGTQRSWLRSIRRDVDAQPEDDLPPATSA